MSNFMKPTNAAERQLRAQKAREGIEVNQHSTAITGEGIPLYRLLVLITGLRFELNTGMKLRRGRSCYTIVREEFKFKGNKKKVLEQLEAFRRENYPTAEEASHDAATN